VHGNPDAGNQALPEHGGRQIGTLNGIGAEVCVSQLGRGIARQKSPGRQIFPEKGVQQRLHLLPVYGQITRGNPEIGVSRGENMLYWAGVATGARTP
jgi:hypothetical protein